MIDRTTAQHRRPAGSAPADADDRVNDRVDDRVDDDRFDEIDPALRAVEAALRGLTASAPPSLLPSTLIAVGLADGYARLGSPLGPVFVAFNGRGISAIVPAGDPDAFEASFLAEHGRPARPVLAIPDRLARAVTRRLAGDRRANVPVDLRDRTPFERAVWEKALEIPRGEVRPYGWIAAEIGHPLAVRAVGTALGRNPVPLVIPCHRVVRSDGTIGQYALGSDAKRAVLRSEGVDVERLEGLAQAGIRYIGSDTTHIYCLPSCRNARRIKPVHEIPFHSGVAAAAAGYRPCRVCRPASAAA
jgi:O-6-methylguanine DNA methyltransferase